MGSMVTVGMPWPWIAFTILLHGRSMVRRAPSDQMRAVALTVIAVALFGSQALSERAFRLLRWFGNRPEPPAPN